jgi:hypothetical protein
VSPVRAPVESHCCRRAAEPCVHDSGVNPVLVPLLDPVVADRRAQAPRASARVGSVVSGRPGGGVPPRAEYQMVRPPWHAEKKLRTASRMGRMAFLLVH